jgi:hypothetical protein
VLPGASELAEIDSGGPARTPPTLQVAMFARRIDQNIRVKPKQLLKNVLTDWTNAAGTTDNDRCVPVAMDDDTTYSNGLTDSCGLPTLRGNAGAGVRDYAEPIFAEATFNPAKPDQLELNFSGSDRNRWRLASQPGQKLIDNLGNIYTVRGVPDPDAASGLGGDIVLIDPPVPGWVPGPNAPDPSGLPSGIKNPSKLRQVVFTPQIPAAATVFTVTRPLQ